MAIQLRVSREVKSHRQRWIAAEVASGVDEAVLHEISTDQSAAIADTEFRSISRQEQQTGILNSAGGEHENSGRDFKLSVIQSRDAGTLDAIRGRGGK